MIAQRHSGTELLRILLMVMIIMHHIVVHGLGLASQDITQSSLSQMQIVALFWNSIAIIGVNTFVVISGFWGITFRLNQFLSLFLHACLYLGIVGILFYFIGFPWSFPLFSYWFLIGYLALYLFSPFINSSLDSLSNTTLLQLILIFIFIQSGVGFFLPTSDIFGGGYSLFQMAYMYVIGRGLRRFENALSALQIQWIRIAYVASLSAFIAIQWLLLSFTASSISRLFQYNNPILVLHAILLFLLFYKSNPSRFYFQWIVPSVFGVYLLHDHYLIRENIVKVWTRKIITDTMEAIYLIPIIAVSLFFVAAIVDIPIRLLAKKISSHICNKWEQPLRHFIKKSLESIPYFGK